MNTRVFKEPLGFIRVIELPLAILAFAAAAGYSATTLINYTCAGTPPATKQTSFDWGYPFKLESITTPQDLCNPGADRGQPQWHPFRVGASSQAQFFVFVGVIAFLYILGILAVYVLMWPRYENDGRLPLADFVITAIWALFWFIASCAWASGVTTIKDVTAKETISADRLNIKEGPVPCNASTPTALACTLDGHWNYASLNVSAIAGFACFALWLANLWFIYKETPWYKARAAITTPQPGTGVGPSGGPTTTTGSPFR